MFLKGLVIVAVLGFCQGAEHAYSSQSIVLHHEHKGHEDHKEHHAVPVEVEFQKAVPLVEYVIESSGHEHKHKDKHEQEHNHEDHGHKHAFSTQHISVHHEHKGHDGHKEEYIIPHKAEVQETVPVVEYVVESSGHKEEHKHEEEHKELNKHEQVEHYDHKHAFSSQHIERHDIPAHPPKGWNDHHGPAKYEFEYKIHDPHTHDNKYQHEARDGHNVKGVYSLHEADGSVRTVHYTADKKTGFQADVSHTTKHEETHNKQH